MRGVYESVSVPVWGEETGRQVRLSSGSLNEELLGQWKPTENNHKYISTAAGYIPNGILFSYLAE